MRLKNDERGFTLAEVAVASVIFLFIALAAFSVFNQSNKLYRSGDSNAEMQQRTRLAFEVMLDELRLAGFDYNRDGDENEYPDATDEQIEYAGLRAVTFRGNLDYNDGSTGREANLEVPMSDPDYGSICCPIVTTANDEIVTYALRSEKSSANRDDIVINVDTTAPRDAEFDNFDQIQNEEEVRITNVDLDGGDPPYSLMRFSIDADGRVTEAPVASSIRDMFFTYLGTDSKEYYCRTYETDGTCASGNQVRFDSLGGADDIGTDDGQRRTARAGIRTMNVELIGMSDKDQMGYVDKNDTLMPGRRKLSLSAAVVPQNLGLKGRPDIDNTESTAPTNVSLCGGQCNTVRVEWDEATKASGYVVKLYQVGQTTPFFTGATPGIAIAGSNPPRVYAYFQRADAAQIVGGAVLIARVASRGNGDETSEDSYPSSSVTLDDVTRVEEPKDVKASGYDPTLSSWPDVVGGALQPVTTGTNEYKAEGNSIVVSWTSPIWALQVTNPSDPANTAVTRTGSGTSAALECDKEPTARTDGGSGMEMRTRARDVFGTRRYLIFRSTNPRFVPTNADFVAAVQGEIDIVAGRVAYRDHTIHNYTNGVFNSTTTALENCTTYYYRVRAVDDCWNGSDPAGQNIHLSPFSPKLNPATSASNSDDVSSLAPEQVSLAIPGYAIPKSAPKAPQIVRFTRYDADTSDGDGKDAVIGFDAVKMDTTQSGSGTTADPFVPAWEDVAIGEYRVFSSASSSFTVADCKNGTNGVVQEAILPVRDLKAGRIAYDDEDLNGNITASEDEIRQPGTWPTGVLPRTSLRIALPTTGSRYYKVVAIQCASENTIPSASSPDTYDWGQVSESRKFPCDFGGGTFSTITVDASAFPSSVTCLSTNETDSVPSIHARLILKDRVSGDRTVTPYPGITPTGLGAGLYRANFGAGDIAQLSDNFGSGNYAIACEMDDTNGCIAISDASNQVLTTPSCCLSSSNPVVTRASQHLTNTVTEACGIQFLRIMKITLTIDNANGSGPEKFDLVTWNGTTIAVNGGTSVTIDRSANPLTLASAQSGSLGMDMSRNPQNDNITIRYDYKIGGVAGNCTFTGRI